MTNDELYISPFLLSDVSLDDDYSIMLTATSSSCGQDCFTDNNGCTVDAMMCNKDRTCTECATSDSSDCSDCQNCSNCQNCEDYPINYVGHWSWSASNGSATATETKAAYSAMRNQGPFPTYKVWNDLVDKVYEVRDALGKSWSTNTSGGLTYSQTRMSSRDKVLTADRFNALRFNIGSLYSTGIYDVSKGDLVYGDYFITLASCLNSLIDENQS